MKYLQLVISNEQYDLMLKAKDSRIYYSECTMDNISSGIQDTIHADAIFKTSFCYPCKGSSVGDIIKRSDEEYDKKGKNNG